MLHIRSGVRRPEKDSQVASRGPAPWRACESVLCGADAVLEYIRVPATAHTGRMLPDFYLKSTFHNMEMNSRIRADHQMFFFT